MMNTPRRTLTPSILRRFAVMALATIPLLVVGCFPTDDDDKKKESIDKPRAMLIDSGTVFYANCMTCHKAMGEGVPGTYPRLANGDYLQQLPKTRIPEVLLRGSFADSNIFVNGIEYEVGFMPSFRYFTDFQIAAVTTYIRAVLNDSTVVTCREPVQTEDGLVEDCDKEPRSAADIASDSVSVSEVKALRDSLTAAGILD